MTMIAEREAEKARLQAIRARTADGWPIADILPHPALLERFASKVEALRASLDNGAVRPEAAQILSRLTESVTSIRPESVAPKPRGWPGSRT